MSWFWQREDSSTRAVHASDAHGISGALKVCTVESLEPRTLLAVTLPDGFEQSQWARGFNTPTAQEFAPDGRLFVTEKAGAVRVVSADGKLLDKPFAKVPAQTANDLGLVSIAIDPDFADNGFVYLYYSVKKQDDTRVNRLSRFKADKDDPNIATDNSERVLFESPMESSIHTGGMMHFGADGMLYLGIGDGASGGRAQKLNELRGKILRLNVANFPNSIIPDDNPFVGENNVREEIWALGFRNPFSGGIDPVTGKIFINDVGHESFEEVNHAQAGQNHGWPVAEGPSSDGRYVNPIYSYPKNNVGAAVTGGLFYRGNAMPAGFNGDYFFADYLRGWIKRLDPDDNNRVVDFATGAEGPLDLDIGPDGNIYYLSAFGNGFSGENRPVYKISWVGSDNRKPDAVATANVGNGGLPLKVKFNGARSSDPDGNELTYSWDFGDGSKPVTDANPNHTFKRKGRYKVRLTVRDGMGGVDRSETIKVLAGFAAPRAKIAMPDESLQYVAGDKIRFAGTGKDAEDGKLKKNRFEWSVVFVHADHTHEFRPSIPGVLEGKFRTATSGETAPDQGYLIRLTVTDRHGLTGTDSVIVRPRKVDVTVRANLKALKFTVDGHEFTGSTTFVGVAGLERELSAPKTQTVNGQEYVFAGWSDKGKRTHVARTPKKDVVYVARYVKAPAPGGEPGENGLAGTYFDAPDFSGTPVQRVDETIDFDWAAGAPARGIDNDTFSVRWFGQVQAKFSEEHTFIVTSDDGARLAVNGKVLIDALDETGLVQRKGRIKLKAGERYDIELEYVEGTGNAVVLLEWKSASTPRQVVPRKRLFAGAEPQQQKGLHLLAAKKTTKAKTPESPTKLVAEARSRRKVRLAWRDNSSNETAFRLYRRGPGESKYTLLAKLPRNTQKHYDQKDVQPDSLYAYKVRAANGAGGSAYSGKAVVLTPALPTPPPPDPDPAPIDGEFNLAWEVAADAPIGRHEAVGTSANGKLYVFGGFTPTLRQINDAHAYDPVTNTWEELPDLPEPMTHGSAVFDGVDKIYVAGFFAGPNHFGDGSTTVYVYCITDNTWSTAPALPARQGAAVMVLVGRNLHFFGGLDPGRTVNSTGHWALNLDDHAAGWTPRATMPNPKDHLAAVELNGRIYAIGGEHLGNDITMNQTDAHAYDPATDTWTEIAPLPIPWSHSSSATLAYGGKIITMGGQTDGRVALKHVMQYDPATNAWTHLRGLPSARKSPVAGIIGNTIVVQGGEGRGPEPTTWIGRIIPVSDEGDEDGGGIQLLGANAMTKPRTIPMSVSLGEVAAGAINGKVYAVGEFNNVTYVYNTKTGAFTSKLPKRPYQGHHHGAEVYDNKLYLIGGLGSGAGKVQIYDPATKAWTLGADMPFAAGSVSTAVIRGRIFVAGGIVGSRTTDQVARYNPATNTWKVLAPMPFGRNHAASGTDGTKFYVFGGRGPGSGDANYVANGFDTVQVYNPVTGKWKLRAPLPQARGGTGKAVFVNGEFYVMGGETSTGAGANEHRVYDRVDIYNPRTNQWRKGRPMLTARHGIFPVLIGDAIYIPAGGVHAGGSHSNILEVYPV